MRQAARNLLSTIYILFFAAPPALSFITVRLGGPRGRVAVRAQLRYHTSSNGCTIGRTKPLLRRRCAPRLNSFAPSDFAAAGPGPCEATSSTAGVSLGDGDERGGSSRFDRAAFLFWIKVAHAYETDCIVCCMSFRHFNSYCILQR